MAETIHETCACGAEFDYMGSSPMLAASRWREGHQHEPPKRQTTIIEERD